MKKFCFWLIGALLSLRCDRIFETLEIDRPCIVNVTPSHLEENVSPHANIRIIFSKDMDREKTNNAFSLTSSNSAHVEGFFRWDDDRTLTFSPRIPLLENCYIIRIEATAEDTEGNDLTERHESVFYVHSDLTPPTIVFHTPADNAIGIHPNPWDDPEQYAQSIIRVVFSEPIDVDSLYSGFTIIPPIRGFFAWNNTHTEITFIPLSDLLLRTTYTITLNTSICDIHGNALFENYSYRFTVGSDFVAPEIASVHCEREGMEPVELQEDRIVEGCEKDGTIVFTFTEPVRRETFFDAVRIAPSKSFYINSPPTSSRMAIAFHEALESETNYDLSISQSVTDLSGNALKRQHRYSFFTNGARSTRPVVLCITDTLHGFVEPYDNYECFANNEIEPVTMYNPDEFIYIIFNKELKPERMNITITRVHGSSGSGLPKITNIDWPLTPFGAFRVYRFNLFGIDANNIYKLTIRGGSSGICDPFGNTLKDDYIQYFKVQSH
ncbi:MAG: Ig-like domain-containing protein [Spirochaetes bacterium]|nr:Ig-like domain-containing protein [Spirochaetota bacterium]